MFTMKRLLCASVLTLGAVAFLATPNTASAQTRINIGVGIGSPIVRPVPYPIVRPVPAPIVYPVVRPSYYPPVVVAPIGHHHYDVLYRDCAHDPWRVYGRYDCREDAERVAYRLERRGNETFIKTIHHHR
jgi:hypothetical protein